ncbi:flagellar hook-associated protein FlgK [Oceanicaulis sp. LC35]|uniref:flagellar hook-associated protein FlgK n=1 Tax=Oceanicaulis sp. LC35 TaxID=3349635 RepID=UPI003F87F4D3
MALNSVIGNALSGLRASQLGLRTASNNVANVNTPGYARTELAITSRNVAGQGMGVDVRGVERITDEYLLAASVRANSDFSAATARYSALDRLQAQFGSTSDESSIFGRLNAAFDSLSAAAADSAETVSRLSAASELQSFFDETERLSVEIRTLRNEADTKIGAGIGRINEILEEMQDLNLQAQSLNASSADTSGAANRQVELLDELSSYIDVRTQRQPDGRVFVSTADGVALLDNSRLQLEYTPAGTGSYGLDYGEITAVVSASGARVDLTQNITSGELRGLIDLRDKDLPQLAAALAEYASGAADALNAAHNDSTAYPPPNTLTGRDTSLVGADVLQGSGAASLAIVNNDGTLVQNIAITVTATGFTVDGNAANSITDLVNELNTALGGNGTASFTNGRLSIDATNPNHGVATVQDSANPSSIGGRGFAHFFGLNDIVDSDRPSFFETGLTATSAHGLAPGGVMSFKVLGPNGARTADIDVNVAGASIQDQLNALNAAGTGLGAYGSFGMDANGEISFTPAAGYERYEVVVTGDTSVRTGTGKSFTTIFGMSDGARMSRAESFEVRPAIRSDSTLLSMAKLEITGATAPGDLVVTSGDNRGGQALAAAGQTKRTFDDAGTMKGGMSTLVEYGARVAGKVGSVAAAAQRSEAAAESVKEAADIKRSDVEGVSLDEELARMIQFQQSYNAAARLLQAAREMSDTLLNIL